MKDNETVNESFSGKKYTTKRYAPTKEMNKITILGQDINLDTASEFDCSGGFHCDILTRAWVNDPNPLMIKIIHKHKESSNKIFTISDGEFHEVEKTMIKMQTITGFENSYDLNVATDALKRAMNIA